MLVLADGWGAGWEATVNGKAASVLPANVAFRGVPVPAGESEVVFRYHPPGLTTGIVATAVSLPLVLLAGWILRRRERRK